MARLTVLHTNDFHNQLGDSGAQTLREAVSALGGTPYLLLDAGDAIKAGNIGVSPFGEPILSLMSDLGYHAMSLGNREFHVLGAALAKKIDDARFPVLCANMRAKAPGGDLPTVAHLSVTLGELRVAILGLTVPMVTERMAARALSDFLFDDPVKVAAERIPELRATHDIVIALTHIGISADRKLAESTPSIDLIIGGHSHVTLQEPEIVNGIPIVSTGSHGRFFGTVALETTPDGRAKIVDSQLRPLSP